MLTVKIHSIGSQHVMSDEDFEYILCRIGMSLPVMSLSYSLSDGHLWCISIYANTESEGDVNCISLFVDADSNNVKFTLEGSIYGTGGAPNVGDIRTRH